MTTLASSETDSTGGLLRITDEEFRRIRTMVYERFGINLAHSKRLLVQGRLSKVLRAQGYANFGEYADELERNANTAGLLSLVDHISTNHSYLFREADHFDYILSTIVPSLEERGVKPHEVRIWSAGASEGQEPYTLAMTLHEHFGGSPFGTVPGILATDISVTALERARAGIFPAAVLDTVPQRYRKYLLRLDAERVQVVDAIRRSILFKRLNLNQERFPFKGLFHIVLCRNVMIYFDSRTKQSLVSRFARHTHDGGYLLIGHSESLGREVSGYRYLRPTVYQRCP